MFRSKSKEDCREDGDLATQHGSMLYDLVCLSEEVSFLPFIVALPLTIPAGTPESVNATDHRSAFEALVAPGFHVFFVFCVAPLL
jgi:hypothetical protein